MRLFFFGPRLFHGFIRPGISVGPEDFRKWTTEPVTAGVVPPDAFLYVAKGDDQHCKIGITGNPQARLVQLNTGSPHPLEFAWIGIPRADGAAIEKDVHAMLANYRRNGEWFAVTPDAAVGAINAAAQRRGHPVLGITVEQAERVRHELLREESKSRGWLARYLWLNIWLAQLPVLVAAIYFNLDWMSQIALQIVAAIAMSVATLLLS